MNPTAPARAQAQGVHCLAIPTPFAVGRVNCYLIEDEPLTLLDAGPNSATSLTALEAALGEHGRRVEDLERIVVTHQHIDHIGLVDILAKRSSAEVCALDLLAPWLRNYRQEMEENDSFSAEIMLRNGIPQDVVTRCGPCRRAFARGAPPPTSPVRWPRASCSSSTPGLACAASPRALSFGHRFLRRSIGELFGGDHLIKHISSNPLISRPLGAPEASGAKRD